MPVMANKKTEVPRQEKPLTLWPISAFVQYIFGVFHRSEMERDGRQEKAEDNAKEAELPVV